MKIAIVDERMPSEAKRKLALSGFYTVDVPMAKTLPVPLSAHPDMIFFVHGKNIISSAEYCDAAPYVFEDITRLIPGVSLTLTSDKFENEYPYDAIFNALVIGNKIFLKKDSVSRAVLEYAEAAE